MASSITCGDCKAAGSALFPLGPNILEARFRSTGIVGGSWFHLSKFPKFLKSTFGAKA